VASPRAFLSLRSTGLLFVSATVTLRKATSIGSNCSTAAWQSVFPTASNQGQALTKIGRRPIAWLQIVAGLEEVETAGLWSVADKAADMIVRHARGERQVDGTRSRHRPAPVAPIRVSTTASALRVQAGRVMAAPPAFADGRRGVRTRVVEPDFTSRNDRCPIKPIRASFSPIGSDQSPCRLSCIDWPAAFRKPRSLLGKTITALSDTIGQARSLDSETI
jgi:hypothetical protein